MTDQLPRRALWRWPQRTTNSRRDTMAALSGKPLAKFRPDAILSFFFPLSFASLLSGISLRFLCSRFQLYTYIYIQGYNFWLKLPFKPGEFGVSLDRFRSIRVGKYRSYPRYRIIGRSSKGSLMDSNDIFLQCDRESRIFLSFDNSFRIAAMPFDNSCRKSNM